MRGLFDTVRAAFHDPHARAYDVVGAVVWMLILISVALVAVDLAWFAGGGIPRLRWLDRGLLAIFAVEYVLRVGTYLPPELAVFDKRRFGRVRAHVLGRLRFMLHPMMLVDLVTVAAVIPELRGLRGLRLLRLLRTARVFRYSNPFTGLFHAFERDRFLFGLAFAFLGLQVLLGGGSLFLIERASEEQPQITSFGEGLWFALVTITTVGYGDFTPVTQLGQVVSSVLMVGGMFTLALFAGIVGHSLLNAVLSVREEQFRMGNYVNHIVVCGYEEGMHLLLDALTAEYDPETTKIVIIADSDRPAEVPVELYWVRGDPTKESELDKVRTDRALAVIVAGPRRASPQQADALTLLIVFTIRSYLKKKKSAAQRSKPLYLVAEILDSENVQHARAAGADEVIETRRLGFSLLAHAIEHHGTADTLSQVVLRGKSSLYVGSIPPEYVGRTYVELIRSLGLRKRGGLAIGVTDERSGKEHVNPPDDLTLDKNMRLLYLAQDRLMETS